MASKTGEAVKLIPYEDQYLEETLALFKRFSPDHPELGQGDILKWQKCYRFVAMHHGKIVGYIAQIPHEFKYGKKSGRDGMEHIGWAVTLVLDMSDVQIRKLAGRGLLAKCENNSPWQYSGVGMVPAVEGPYIRRGHAIRRDCSKMYARFMRPATTLKYIGKSSIYAPAISLVNTFLVAPRDVRHGRVEKIKEFKPEWDEIWSKLMTEQYELYGVRDAEYLNYKLTQPNRDYNIYVHVDETDDALDGYIVFRHATHRTKDLNLVKVCDLVGTNKAKAELLTLAVKLAYEVRAYGIVAMGSYSEEKMYRRGGLYISKPYAIAMPPHIKAKMHISFFDSDLDNLW